MNTNKQQLYSAAKAAMKNAHAPYSKYHVGAAVLAENGEIYAGTNVENASYPEGWCAETSAIAAMVTAGARVIIEACVITDDNPPGTPCGGCRQRLSEFAESATPIHIADLSGIVHTWRMDELLPGAFKLRS